ncbi:MAG: hypothetical protein EXR67_00590 [Dehalococcoidia bacterium]|nr:hypothetical protein [Dehalococcoidia bacterium]
MLAIVAALEQEVTKDGQFPFRWSPDRSFGAATKVWRGRRHTGVVLVVSGMGREAAQRAVQMVCAREHPMAIVGIGFAGALEFAFRAGDLMVPSALHVSPSRGTLTPELKPNKSLVKLILESAQAQKLVAHDGPMVTVDAVAGTAETKQQLAQQSRAVGVDMETYWLAEAAHRQGIPFAAMRAIVDELGDSLPKLAQQEPSAGNVLGSILKNPLQLPSLYMLWQKSDKARRSLTLCMFEFIEQFSKRPTTATIE